MEKTWTMPYKGPLNSRYGTHSIHSKRGRGWIWNGCAVCLATQPHQNTHALVHTTHMSSDPKDQLNALATDQSHQKCISRLLDHVKCNCSKQIPLLMFKDGLLIDFPRMIC